MWSGVSSPTASGGAPPASAIETSAPDAWWRADSGVTEVGGGVSSFVDRTSNAWDMIQPTAASRPVYSATAVGGQPGLVFDGVDDAVYLDGTDTLSPSTDDFSLFMALTHDNSSNSGSWISNAGTSGFRIYDKNPRYTIDDGPKAKTSFANPSLLLSGLVIACFRFDRSGNLNAYINDNGSVTFFSADISTVTGDISSAPYELALGGTKLPGSVTAAAAITIGEVAIWRDRLLTDQEVSDIGAELATRYGGTFVGPV